MSSILVSTTMEASKPKTDPVANLMDRTPLTARSKRPAPGTSRWGAGRQLMATRRSSIEPRQRLLCRQLVHPVAPAGAVAPARSM